MNSDSVSLGLELHIPTNGALLSERKTAVLEIMPAREFSLIGGTWNIDGASSLAIP